MYVRNNMYTYTCLLTVSVLCPPPPPPPLQSGLPPDAEPGVERDGLDAAQVLWAELNRTDQPVEFAVQASSHASFGAPRGQQQGGRGTEGRMRIRWGGGDVLCYSILQQPSDSGVAITICGEIWRALDFSEIKKTFV